MSGHGHKWDESGERCLLCGDKDWRADEYCSKNPDTRAEYEEWIEERRRANHEQGNCMQRNVPGDSCPKCGSSEVDSNSPRTKYACGSSDYDGRPGTFRQSDECIDKNRMS